MFLLSLLSLARAEHRTIDLCVFTNGKWNVTGGYLDESGDFHPEDFYYNFTLKPDEDDDHRFTGILNGYKKDDKFELVVTIGRENNQSFKIERYYFPKSVVLAEGTLEYGLRNMPHVSGKDIQKNGKQRKILYYNRNRLCVAQASYRQHV